MTPHLDDSLKVSNVVCFRGNQFIINKPSGTCGLVHHYPHAQSVLLLFTADTGGVLQGGRDGWSLRERGGEGEGEGRGGEGEGEGRGGGGGGVGC